MLIVTGGVAPEGAAPVGTALGRARWSQQADTVSSWRVRLLQTLGIPMQDAWPCAAALARARGEVDTDAWLATPVHIVAGIDRAFLASDGLLQLDAAEWRALCDGFARHFGGEGLRLEPIASATALLRGAALGEVHTLDPEECRDADLRQRLPRGPGAARWRKLVGEIELWLHAEPWNRQRARNGRAPVTSLWLWGGAAEADMAAAPEQRVSGPVRRATRWCLVGEDPWLAALPALHAGCVASPASDFDALLRGDEDAVSAAVLWRAESGLAELERRWLRPACRALARGALATLTLHHAQRGWRMDRMARWRWWQPRRSIAELTAVPHV